MCNSCVAAKFLEDSSKVERLGEQTFERLIEFLSDFLEHVDFDEDENELVDALQRMRMRGMH